MKDSSESRLTISSLKREVDALVKVRDSINELLFGKPYDSTMHEHEYTVSKGQQSDGTSSIPAFFVENKKTKAIEATTSSEALANKICWMLNEGF